MDFKALFHDLANVVSVVLHSSGLDAQTRADLQGKLDGVKSAAGSVVSETAATAEATFDAAPTIAGEAAGKLTSEAVSHVPGGSAFSDVLGMVAQAAATLAVSHFTASLVAHNGDHLKAAQATLDSIKAATATTVQATGEPDAEVPPAA